MSARAPKRPCPRPRVYCPVCTTLTDAVRRNGEWRTIAHRDHLSLRLRSSSGCKGSALTPAAVREAALKLRASLILTADGQTAAREKFRQDYESSVARSERVEAEARADAASLEKLVASLEGAK